MELECLLVAYGAELEEDTAPAELEYGVGDSEQEVDSTGEPDETGATELVASELEAGAEVLW